MSDERFKRTVYHFQRRPVVAFAKNSIWSVDLVDMNNKPDEGYRYILNCVDVFTRKLYTMPIESKTTNTLINAFNELTQNNKPDKIWSDKEGALLSEKFQSWLQTNHIELYHTNNSPHGSAIVERLNRTMREHMVKDLGESVKGWSSWLGIFEERYNNKQHTTTGLTPEEAQRAKNKGELTNQNEDKLSENVTVKKKFQIGDRVRIQRQKGIFEKKSATPNWSHEIFTIKYIKQTMPITYIIQNSEKQMIEGSYYTQQLLKTNE